MFPNSAGLPEPIPGIVQKQHRDWMRIVAEIAQLAQNEDETALTMGDRLVEIEKSFGRKHLQEAAKQAGVSWSVARQRHWVSGKIPEGHMLRGTPLTFCHLRALCGLEVEAMAGWAEKALTEQWSVARLIAEIEAVGDVQAQEAGDPCIQCEESLPEQGEIVSFTLARQKRARLCGVQCAAAYFAELAEDL
jgi:hypothetical protein